MVVDPAFKKIIELFNASELSNISVEDLRKVMSENLFFKEKEEVKFVKDLSFEHHGIRIPCRLYEPNNATEELIIYLHGGGFVFGDIEMSDNVCRKAANKSGCKVLPIEYRLAPENKFPSAVDDAYESYLWARNNYRMLGIDPDKIAIAGDSAGGNLSAVVCLKSKDNNVLLPKVQVLFYPVLGPDLFSESMREHREGYFLTEKQMLWFNYMYLNSSLDAFNVYFSPILYKDFKGLPEAIIITAEHDPLRDQGEMYLARLYNSGVQATGIRAKGMIHGFLNFSDLVPAAESIASMVWYAVGQKLRR